MPAASVWSAVIETAALSAIALTFFVDVQAKVVQVGVSVTAPPPMLTETVLPFSLQAPLTVYAVLLALLIVGAEVMETVGAVLSTAIAELAPIAV